MSFAVRQRFMQLALLAMVLLTLMPTLGRICASSSTRPAHAHLVASGHGHHDDGGAPLRHDGGTCAYCAILGGTDLAHAGATSFVSSVVMRDAQHYASPAYASRAWTLGSRGPPRHDGA